MGGPPFDTLRTNGIHDIFTATRSKPRLSHINHGIATPAFGGLAKTAYVAPIVSIGALTPTLSQWERVPKP